MHQMIRETCQAFVDLLEVTCEVVNMSECYLQLPVTLAEFIQILYSCI